MTIVNWFMATSLPRTAAGAISAMYIGERFEAKPMATPPAIRQRLKARKVPINPVPIEEMTKTIAEKTRSHLRPSLSLRLPEMSAPMRQPMSALPIAQPFSEADCRLKNRS